MTITILIPEFTLNPETRQPRPSVTWGLPRLEASRFAIVLQLGFIASCIGAFHDPSAH
jgi:hypothetical protein